MAGAAVSTSRVVSLYRRGRTIRDIAAETGLSKGTVWNRLVAAGEPRRMKGFPGADLGAIKRRYLAGEPVAAIATDLGMSESAIQTRLRRHGIPARSDSAAALRAAALEAIRAIDRGCPGAARAVLAEALGTS
jgi:DNA-binding Lrp family transcriptional regulator